MTRTLTNALQDSPTLQTLTEDSHTAPWLLHSFLGGGRWTSRHSHQNCTCKNTVYRSLTNDCSAFKSWSDRGGEGGGRGKGGGRRGDNLRCDHGWSCARLGWSWVRAAAVPPACDLNWDWIWSMIIIIPFALMFTNLVPLEFLSAQNDVKRMCNGMQAVLSPTLGPSRAEWSVACIRQLVSKQIWTRPVDYAGSPRGPSNSVINKMHISKLFL